MEIRNVDRENGGKRVPSHFNLLNPNCDLWCGEMIGSGLTDFLRLRDGLNEQHVDLASVSLHKLSFKDALRNKL